MLKQPLNALADITFIFSLLKKKKKKKARGRKSSSSLQVPPCTCGSQVGEDRPGSMGCVIFTEAAD